MRYLRDRIVIITGAGFSASANLPVQNKILEEMETPAADFINFKPRGESIKFLAAYISVAIYLLKEYSKFDVVDIEKEFQELESNHLSSVRVAEVLDFIQMRCKEELDISSSQSSISMILDSVADKYIINSGQFCVALVDLKERLRRELNERKIRISLEDIFTSFDKSINTRENTLNYTYSQMDSLQHSILRLFVYYFSERTNEHSYHSSDYLEVIQFIKKNKGYVSLITTNWDVLLEEYLAKCNLRFDYKFNGEYVLDNYSDNNNLQQNNESSINFIKVHGSINWFRCLRCGTLQVCDRQECGQYLFDDLKKEKCNKCGQVAVGSSVQMKPEIITPTMLKTIDGQLYNNIWRNAANELRKADKIIFCGYSLPTADFEFRYLLKQNINPKAQIDVVLYHDDNPKMVSDKNAIRCLLPEKRFRDLFSNNKCIFYYDGFGKYFANMNKL